MTATTTTDRICVPEAWQDPDDHQAHEHVPGAVHLLVGAPHPCPDPVPIAEPEMSTAVVLYAIRVGVADAP